MENRMLMRWETPELKHLLLLGKENKSGTFYMPEDKLLSSILSRVYLREATPPGLTSGFPQLTGVELSIVILRDKSPENSSIPCHMDTYNYTYSWGTEGEHILFYSHMRLTLLFTWTGRTESKTAQKHALAQKGKYCSADLALWLHLQRGAYRRDPPPHNISFLCTLLKCSLTKIKLLQKFHYWLNSGSDLEWWVQ